MSADANRELVRRFYEQVVGLNDLSLLDYFIAPDYLDHNDEGAGRGPEVFRGHMAALRGTFPDFTLTVEEILAEDDKVVTRVSGRGTHGGEWMGIKPTGKTVSLRGINIDRVENGRMAEHWGHADTVGMLLQMGVDPFAGRPER
jgi:predicted ester cyclase